MLALTVSPWWWLGRADLRAARARRAARHHAEAAQHHPQLPDRRAPALHPRGHGAGAPSVPGGEQHRRRARSTAISARSSTSGPRASPTPSRSAPSRTSTPRATRSSSTRSPRARWRRIPCATCASRSAEPHCKQPYSLSVLNISAMSFGALGGNAVLAMNTGAKTRQLRPRHRRGRHLPLSPRRRRRPDLADRHRLLRLPQQGDRRLRSRPVREERDRSADQDDRDQGVAGREARPRRHPSRRQGDRGDRRGAPRRGRQDRVLADVPPGVLDAARDDARSSPSCASSRAASLSASRSASASRASSWPSSRR